MLSMFMLHNFNINLCVFNKLKLEKKLIKKIH